MKKLPGLMLSLALLISGCNLERIDPGGPGSGTKFTTLVGDSGQDEANDLILTSDGGYVVVGDNLQAGNYQAYIAKLNGQGDLQWERLFGGANYETAKAVVQASDGGFVFCGQTANDIYLLKVNASGDKVWEKTYGSVDSTEYAFGIVPSGTNGDFMVSFMSTYPGSQSIGLLKINANGLKLSSQFVRTGTFYMSRMIKTSDNNLVLVGDDSPSGTSTYVLKLNASGGYIWENRFPESNPNFTPAYGIVEMANGDLIAAGSDLGNNDHDFNLVAFNAIGGFKYNYTWGGANADELQAITKTADGEIMVVGYTSSFSGQNEIYLSKRKAADGTKIWEKHFENISNIWNDIELCPDGGFVLSAMQSTANADIIIIKTDAEGNYQ